MAPFQLKWDSLSSIYVLTEFIDYISSFSSHEKYENGETYILGSLNASMCKAMRVKIIRKKKKCSTMKMLELADVEHIKKNTMNELFVNVGNFHFTSACLFSNTHSLTLRAHAETNTNTNTLIQFARIESFIRFFNAPRKSTQ